MTKTKHLAEGDIVVLNGRDYTVLANRKVDGGWSLTVADGTGVPFSKVVPGKREFETRGRAPLHDEDGAQTRWASQEDVEQVLGGVQLYQEEATADGLSYKVADVDFDTVAAHLLAFHHVTSQGVSLAEARRVTPDAERTLTPEEALKQADFEGMLAMHTALHLTGDAPVRHTHGGLI